MDPSSRDALTLFEQQTAAEDPNAYLNLQDNRGVSADDIISRANYRAANPGMVDPARAINDPRGVTADVIRGNFDYFNSTAVPVIKSLEGMTTYAGHTGVVEGLKTDARNNAKAAFGGMAANAQRDAQSFGMSLTPSAAGTIERSAKLGMAAATVDGVNRANTYQQDLNRQLVAGSNLSTVKS